MTGRERLQAIINRQPVDRLPWVANIDLRTTQLLPHPQYKGKLSLLDFYRLVGCDILQRDGGDTGWKLQSPRFVMPGVEEVWSTESDGTRICQARCSKGTLTSKVSASGHPVEYPLKTIKDVRLLIERYESSYYEELDDSVAFAAINEAVGSDGIVIRRADPTAIPLLAEELAGMENFYYLLMDYPDEMDALIRVIQEKDRERFEILARGPADTVIITENTSTTFLSPEVYERYNMPSQRDFVEILHRKGKTAILHMCGHVLKLLDLIKETCADGIHALTPPPVGDCPWEAALDVLGDDLIIFGILPPNIFIVDPAEHVAEALDGVITQRVRESPFVLTVASDGLSVPLERYAAVREWVESQPAKCLVG